MTRMLGICDLIVPNGVRNVSFAGVLLYITLLSTLILCRYLEDPMMTSHTSRSRPGRGSEAGTTKKISFSRMVMRAGMDGVNCINFQQQCL